MIFLERKGEIKRAFPEGLWLLRGGQHAEGS